jgi:hypothetical protein
MRDEHMLNKNRKILKFIAIIFIFVVSFLVLRYFYYKDRNKYEPLLWQGFFDYRLNFRDVAQSLNQCMGKDLFQTGLVYRSNKYFSGWSCDKINNPQKIYSLNFSPWNPHSYFCERSDGTKLYGYYPNTTFEISDIEKVEKWKDPLFKETMCIFFNETLHDLTQKNSFLYHCDVGRDRTGAFTAMISMMMAEQKKLPSDEVINAIECDFEKTSALEKEQFGKMKKFMLEMKENGGVSKFIENTCEIKKETIAQAAEQFVKNN